MDTIIGSQFPKKVIPYIENARKSIDIIVFDWRWYPQDIGAPVQLFNQAIVRAVRRGVTVRAVVNSDAIKTVLLGVGVVAKKLDTSRLVHVKLMVVDGESIIIGSHNYTQNAFQTNYELSVIISQPQDVSDIKTFFSSLWGA